MTQLVLTAVGDDREGLVSALSTAVESHGGNWLDSEFARLAGKFAGVVLVEVPTERVAAFSAAATGLHERLGWKVDVTPGASGAVLGREVQVRLVGLDRPGMVRQISTALAEQHVSIASLHSWTRSAPDMGGLLFEASATVTLPDGVEVEAVRAALEPIADELMVDLEMVEPS